MTYPENAYPLQQVLHVHLMLHNARIKHTNTM